jgi:hypothetical protein
MAGGVRLTSAQETKLAGLLREFRAANPTSRATRCWRYSSNGGGKKEAACLLCNAPLASWSARHAMPQSASDAILSHLIEHAEAASKPTLTTNLRECGGVTIRTVMATLGDEWCEMRVELQPLGDDKMRLSITGNAGHVVSEVDARQTAIDHWVSYFDETPDARREMNERCGVNLRTSLSAARYVVACDGGYHGLDVHRAEGGKVWLTESCGQIQPELREWFPDAAPMLKWHLNDMRSAKDGPQWSDAEWGYEELPPEVITWAIEGDTMSPPREIRCGKVA